MIRLLLFLFIICSKISADAASRQDTLRGSNGPGRTWWDVTHYKLTIHIDTGNNTIRGSNHISFKIIAPPSDSMQIDLQSPLQIDSAFVGEYPLKPEKDGNVWWLIHPFNQLSKETDQTVTIHYSGAPRIAKSPPWDGGLIYTRDSMGNPWISVACQGVGASSWWPCKDSQSDRPDKGVDLYFITDSHLPLISNGRLISNEKKGDKFHWHWRVKSPINNYNISFYLGDYISWRENFNGANGNLDLQFFALRYNYNKARSHFKVVPQMLECFEYWLGPYPFYIDAYKLVEAPFAGMEHQSAIAYGNQYKPGYNGNDRSGTGIGMHFDFIIIHESGHEWFGNSVTAADPADNWIHEGFTTYTEALFVSCLLDNEAADKYTRGEWRNIRNDRPVIGKYGINDPGSGDRYDKGAALVHMIRKHINNDERFRLLLQAINQNFYQQTVSSEQMENFIAEFTGPEVRPLFDQYLRTKMIPKLEYFIKEEKLFYRVTHAVPLLKIPLVIENDKKKVPVLVTEDWQYISWKPKQNPIFKTDYLIQLR